MAVETKRAQAEGAGDSQRGDKTSSAFYFSFFHSGPHFDFFFFFRLLFRLLYDDDFFAFFMTTTVTSVTKEARMPRCEPHFLPALKRRLAP